jgi:hypothetical protein
VSNRERRGMSKKNEQKKKKKRGQKREYAGKIE